MTPGLPTLLAADSQPATSVNEAVAPYLGVFLVALVVTLIATPIMGRIAHRAGIVDHPDLVRKTHTRPIAYLGGVALFLGWLAGVLLCFFIPSPVSFHGRAIAFPIGFILAGAFVITTIGLVDDIYHVSPRVKVGGQMFAAACLALQKVEGEMLGQKLVNETVAVVGGLLSQGHAVTFNPHIAYVIGTAVIAVFVIGGCNALNLMDGLDGLAAGVTGICSVGFLFISVYVATNPGLVDMASDPLANPLRVIMCLAILGAVLGFLPFNFNPAVIFMGDAGSLLLGYLCVATILLFTHTAASGPQFVTAALIVFALPITDTTLAIVRRKIRGQPLLHADNQHIHHQLVRLWSHLRLGPNVTVKLAVLSMYGLAAVFAVLGCLMVYPRGRYAFAVFVVLFVFIIVTAFKLGHRHAAAALAQPPLVAPPPTGQSLTPPTSSAGSLTQDANNPVNK